MLAGRSLSIPRRYRFLRCRCLVHLIWPSQWKQEQEAVYGLLVSLQSELLTKLRDGAVARDVYVHALNYVKEKKPELEKHFVKNIGFGVRQFPLLPSITLWPFLFQMGMEFRDSTYLLSAKNGRTLKSNMVFNLALGFTDLDEDDGKKSDIFNYFRLFLFMIFLGTRCC